MHPESTRIHTEKASTPKTVIFLMVLALLLIVALIVFGAIRGSLNRADTTRNTVKNTTSTPDPVKRSSGANGDTQPSSTGTGSGSSNSLLGPKAGN